jgi:ribosomal protein L11 methyltransferase PrmA
MPHLALTLELTGLDPVAAEDACFAAGAVAVTLTDAADDAILEPKPGEERLWPRTVLQALFDADAASPALLAGLAAQLGVAPERLVAERVADRVWEREWLKDFHAMRFGRRLWIVPHHEDAPADPAAVVVRLDPGLAFGTGTHPSTALCLAWLDACFTGAETVIDYGCGSGRAPGRRRCAVLRPRSAGGHCDARQRRGQRRRGDSARGRLTAGPAGRCKAAARQHHLRYALRARPLFRKDAGVRFPARAGRHPR